jgi:tetratricopeptide (TPR) repeat protein
MKRLLSFILLISTTQTFAQTSKQEIKKAVELFNSGKIDSAIVMMELIKDKEPSTNNWDMLVKMYRERYEYARTNFTNNLVALIGQNMGADMKQNDFASPAVCYNDMINKSREAALYSESPTASQLLRNYLVDYDSDTAVSKEALDERNKAEDFFEKKDYPNAKLHYQKALAIHPGYYAATLYLGDTYWYLGNMDSAISYFYKALAMNPGLLEPRKYLVDALAYDKKNARALTECYNGIFIYPDQSMFMKYADLVKRDGKTFEKQWIKRGSAINNIRTMPVAATDPAWNAYQQAPNNIKMYCDSNGIIIKPNTLTKSKYLEVYSWEHLLAKATTKNPELEFAKKMADAGFLDCYVFISVFHYDMYDQYKDFAKNNKERIKQYMENYLVH